MTVKDLEKLMKCEFVKINKNFIFKYADGSGFGVDRYVNTDKDGFDLYQCFGEFYEHLEDAILAAEHNL